MKDILIMKIIVTEEKKALKYIVLDPYKEGLSAMARTTGYMNTTFIELLNKTKLETGVQPPELIGKTKNITST